MSTIENPAHSVVLSAPIPEQMHIVHAILSQWWLQANGGGSTPEGDEHASGQARLALAALHQSAWPMTDGQLIPIQGAIEALGRHRASLSVRAPGTVDLYDHLRAVLSVIALKNAFVEGALAIAMKDVAPGSLPTGFEPGAEVS
jgi:hypothetical protein